MPKANIPSTTAVTENVPDRVPGPSPGSETRFAGTASPIESSYVGIPARFITQFMPGARASTIKVYLYLCTQASGNTRPVAYITAAQIAKFMKLTPSMIFSAVKTLEAAGFISYVRQRNKPDGYEVLDLKALESGNALEAKVLDVAEPYITPISIDVKSITPKSEMRLRIHALIADIHKPMEDISRLLNAAHGNESSLLRHLEIIRKDHSVAPEAPIERLITVISDRSKSYGLPPCLPWKSQ